MRAFNPPTRRHHKMKANPDPTGRDGPTFETVIEELEAKVAELGETIWLLLPEDDRQFYKSVDFHAASDADQKRFMTISRILGR